jgi:hypothetical protein
LIDFILSISTIVFYFVCLPSCVACSRVLLRLSSLLLTHFHSLHLLSYTSFTNSLCSLSSTLFAHSLCSLSLLTLFAHSLCSLSLLTLFAHSLPLSLLTLFAHSLCSLSLLTLFAHSLPLSLLTLFAHSLCVFRDHRYAKNIEASTTKGPSTTKMAGGEASKACAIL